jgi:hypothetical protein
MEPRAAETGFGPYSVLRNLQIIRVSFVGGSSEGLAKGFRSRPMTGL